MLHYRYYMVLLRSHLLWLILSLRMDLTDSYGLANVNAAHHNLQGNLLPNIDKSYPKPLPNREETIEEVQKILHQDPTLPRLTKGEIEELYEKVTQQEFEKRFNVGDRNRAESMRALMLVLPFNTDNSTEENLQELFTRPPVTRVVDTDISHQPIQFVTPSKTWKSRNKNISAPAVGIMEATTYKPYYSLKTQSVEPNPTTYHPNIPPSNAYRPSQLATSEGFQPFKPVKVENKSHLTRQRFSSHYNAENTDFLKINSQKAPSIIGKDKTSDLEEIHLLSDEYDISESAPKPVFSTYLPQSIDGNDEKGSSGQGLTAHIKPDAYFKFKPLNIGEEIRVKPGVEGYLTRFGIVRGRKRKEIRTKYEGKDEQVGLSSETATKTLLPLERVNGRKNILPIPSNTELEKLLKNLQELERLQIKPKAIKSRTITTPRPSKETTTTTNTSILPSLITNGSPKLIEAKKPRRRIDPNIDINFGNKNNHETATNDSDQLAKLLQNLHELEKLQINPQNVLRKMAPLAQIPKASTRSVNSQLVATTITTTGTSTMSPPKQTIINRFNEQQQQSLRAAQQQQQLWQQQQQQLLLLQQQTQKAQTQTQPDLQQLQRILLQLQNQEKPKSKTTTTPTTTTSSSSTTTTTTLKPIVISNTKKRPEAPIIPNDLWQLRKLLTNDEELEKLFEQAKARQQQQKQQQQQQQQKQKPIITTTTTTSTTTTSTTKKPLTQQQLQHQHQQPSLNDLSQLQKYLAALDREQQFYISSTTARPIATTTTTTARPTSTTTTATTTTTASTTPIKPIPTQPTLSNTLTTDWRSKKQNVNNEQLEALITRVQQLERLNNQNLNQQQQQHQQPSPLTTDTPLTDLLGFTTRNVKNPVLVSEQLDLPINDFANLRTLYKQQLQDANRQFSNHHGEVEISTAATAVKIQKNNFNNELSNNNNNNKKQQFAQRIIDITNDTGTGSSLAQVDPREFVQLQKLLSKVQELERVRITTLPTTTTTTTTTPAPQPTTTDPSNFFTATLSQLNQNNLQKSKNLHVVYASKETTTTERKNIATKETMKSVNPPDMVAASELEKLLNNAKELKQLGIKLPEIQINKQNDLEKSSTSETTTSSSMKFTNDVASDRTAVFSLTTVKSFLPRPTKPTTTESSAHLPVFSATKIIEDAILRAASKIGVSTETPKNLLTRRSDDNTNDILTTNDESEGHTSNVEDLLASFSEMYSEAVLPENSNISLKQVSEQQTIDLRENLPELQRLIKNLQELQKLNLSSNPTLLRQADQQYFENLKRKQKQSEEVVTVKVRRQSSLSEISSSTTNNPTRIQLDLNLNVNEDPKAATETSTTSTAITTTTTTPAPTTEESRNGSLRDLEDSFGPDPNAQEPPPPQRKNGFYFLADWNSFLEVGDGDDQVVVRLSPKVGDPRLFIPVRIP